MADDGKQVEQGGFSYWVSDEQLRAFLALTPLQRLQWADAARRFTLAGQTPETRERMERLRRGLTIVYKYVSIRREATSKDSLTRRSALLSAPLQVCPSAALQVCPCPVGRGFVPLSHGERGQG